MNALDLLEAGRAASDAPECPYAPLLGSWRVRSRWFLGDGSTREGEGEWHFSLILGGFGVQDVLYRAGDPAERRGTSLRCFDMSTGNWRVCWMSPAGGEFVSLVVRVKEDRIIQEGEALDGSSLQRWTFSEMTADGFLWQGEGSVDGGATWRLDQEIRGTRAR